MIPTIGRIVLVKNPNKVVNGSTEFPAIITSVISGEMINCRVFEDNNENPPWYTSVSPKEHNPGYPGVSWRWPPRAEEQKMELTATMEIALVTFAAVVVAQLLKGAIRMITSFIKRTPTTLDDKIWNAVVNGIQHSNYSVGNVSTKQPVSNQELYNPTSTHYIRKGEKIV